MYKLRNIAPRGTMFVGAGALLFASFASGTSAFADALNPLTHRSLTLSSGAPGWDFTDGSGNSTYAPPNSGANGQKTGNTFTFNVSTDSSGSDTTKDVKGFSFQYCTRSAGTCQAPGDNQPTGGSGVGTYTGRELNSANISAGIKRSDLNIVSSTPSEVGTSDYATYLNADGSVKAIPLADNGKGNFVVLTKDVGASSWTQASGWTMSVVNKEDGTVADGTKTGTNNYIRLVNSTGLELHSGGAVKVVFFGTNTNYITNPGSGAFFVKINDYNSADATTGFVPANVIDGGVTVANVMNQSIQITTKVLETMDFSVGTVDPYTLSSTDGTTSTPSKLQAALGVAATTPANNTKHGQCDPILPSLISGTGSPNTLYMGDQAGENSLKTTATYSTHSYWRLSSNSSAGASVYYAGVTLKNTVNDEIGAIGTSAAAPTRGTEQFGLALANGTRTANMTGPNVSGDFAVNYGVENNSDPTKGLFENGADATASTQGIDASVATDITAQGLGAAYHAPRLAPLAPEANYDQGAGNVNSQYGSVNTMFAFDPLSNQIPSLIATESNKVVDCVTGKMRYIANIAATTPAGIYTTKINYIAAPQY